MMRGTGRGSKSRANTHTAIQKMRRIDRIKARLASLWPWNRNSHQETVRKAVNRGAAAVLPLASTTIASSSTGPSSILRTWNQHARGDYVPVNGAAQTVADLWECSPAGNETIAISAPSGRDVTFDPWSPTHFSESLRFISSIITKPALWNLGNSMATLVIASRERLRATFSDVSWQDWSAIHLEGSGEDSRSSASFAESSSDYNLVRHWLRLPSLMMNSHPKLTSVSAVDEWFEERSTYKKSATLGQMPLGYWRPRATASSTTSTTVTTVTTTTTTESNAGETVETSSYQLPTTEEHDHASAESTSEGGAGSMSALSADSVSFSTPSVREAWIRPWREWLKQRGCTVMDCDRWDYVVMDSQTGRIAQQLSFDHGRVEVDVRRYLIIDVELNRLASADEVAIHALPLSDTTSGSGTGNIGLSVAAGLDIVAETAQSVKTQWRQQYMLLQHRVGIVYWRWKCGRREAENVFSQVRYLRQYFVDHPWGISIESDPQDSRLWAIFMHDETSHGIVIERPWIECTLVEIGEELWKIWNTLFSLNHGTSMSSSSPWQNAADLFTCDGLDRKLTTAYSRASVIYVPSPNASSWKSRWRLREQGPLKPRRFDPATGEIYEDVQTPWSSSIPLNVLMASDWLRDDTSYKDNAMGGLTTMNTHMDAWTGTGKETIKVIRSSMCNNMYERMGYESALRNASIVADELCKQEIGRVVSMNPLSKVQPDLRGGLHPTQRIWPVLLLPLRAVDQIFFMGTLSSTSRPMPIPSSLRFYYSGIMRAPALIVLALYLLLLLTAFIGLPFYAFLK